ncbi:MAG: heme biosynthesis HemY N-terminal domain-containing protein [Rickettsiales bacterium]
MARFILFLLLLVPLVFAGDWLMAHPGEVTVRWFEYEITLHVAVVALLLLVAAIFLSVVTSLLWQLTTWPERRRARRKYRTLARGLTQLTHGVTALALGDEAAAHAALGKALLALPGEPLPQLLSAQLLQREGRHDEARVHLRALMRHEITAPLATRRLIEQHVARLEFMAATSLAEQARADAPKDRWLVLTLLDLYARQRNVASMLALTEGWHWQSPLSRDERHHYAALAHYLSARGEPDAHKKAQALRHATGYASEFLPATLAYARWLIDEGDAKKARKWLRATWNADANLLLIAPILAALRPETPRAQLRYLKPFLSGEPTLAALLLAAQQAMQVGEPERAKPLATQAVALEECRESCAVMAEVERELNGSVGANPWLARAMHAPQAASWVCADCGTLDENWQPHCNHCQHFDRIHYERPEARITSVELATA